MTQLNRTNSNWSIEERRKINENWEILERGVNQQNNENNGLKTIVEESKINADKAVNTAQQANKKSDSAINLANEVQNQFDRVVSEGDSNPEVVQARDTFVNLRQRLDGQYNEITTQLEQNTYNVVNYGADPTGSEDSTQAIRAALEALKETGGRLLFPKGTYLHGDGIVNAKPTGYTQSGTYSDVSGEYPRFVPNNGVAYPYYLKDNTYYPLGDVNIGTNITIEIDGIKNSEIIGYGAIIKANPNNSCIKNNAGFVIKNTENLTIKGLEYDGSISDRQPFLVDAGNYNLQHGFYVTSNCKNIIFEEVKSNNCVMDGFYINSSSAVDISYKNCVALRNYRQGLSSGTVDGLYIEGGTYAETGTIYGTLPMSGIDFESGVGKIKNAVVKKVRFYGNAGPRYGLQFHKNTENSTVEECLFLGNYFYEDASGINNTVKNNTFQNAGIISHGGGTYIDDNKFYFDSQTESTDTFITSILSDNTENSQVSGLARKGRIKGNYIQCATENLRSNITYFGGIDSGTNVNDVEGNVIVNAFSTTGTGVVNGTPITFVNNKVIYNGSLVSIGRVNGGVMNYNNNVTPTYTSNPSYPYNAVRFSGTESIKSNISDTGITTTEHKRVVISSRESQSSGEESAVIASGNVKTQGARSSVISSGSTAGNYSYPCENIGENSTILASRAVRNEEPFVVVGGYRGPAAPNTARTVDRKWKLESNTGNIIHSGVITSGHAFSDFAELFPNISGVEQGLGLLQTLDGHGVRVAQEGDVVIGVTSGTAGLILGDTPFSWRGRWLKDEFGSYIYEDILDEGTGKIIKVPKENPEWEPELEQLSRLERPQEWSVVGLVGQVYVRVDDGVNEMDYIKPFKNGIGTKSDFQTNLQVMKITTDYKKDKGYAVAFCLLK